MTRLPTGRPGQLVAVLLLLLVLAAGWTAVGAPLLDWYAERSESVGRRAALARRMAQIAASLPMLQQEADAFSRSGPAPIAVLQGASDAVAGAALQQRVQELATGAGTALTSTESLPVEQLGAYRRVGVRVAVRAPWPVLVGMLARIEAGTPQMLIDDLQVHGQRGFIRDGAAPLEASMVVMGFRAGTGP